APGDQIILYSDGLIEAHNPHGEMFSFPRLRDLLARPACSNELIPCMVAELAAFTGPDWEQEDDVTFVSLARETEPEPFILNTGEAATEDAPAQGDDPGTGRRLAEFTITSQPGNERQAMDRVAEAVAQLGISAARMEKLKTAVAEA